jgi:hypothetical protein
MAPDGGGGVRTAFGGLLRRWARGFNLLFTNDSVNIHLVGHVDGDEVCKLGIGVAVGGASVDVALPVMSYTVRLSCQD